MKFYQSNRLFTTKFFQIICINKTAFTSALPAIANVSQLPPDLHISLNKIKRLLANRAGKHPFLSFSGLWAHNHTLPNSCPRQSTTMSGVSSIKAQQSLQ